jgi:phosphoglycolate phosphatase-like HAD superfamily hydrolase
MSNFTDDDYRKYLLPRRLIFFDLDGTIIPSTAASGRRIAISMSTYNEVREFSRDSFQAPELPEIDEALCSEWYRSHGGPHGLIKRILKDTELPEEVKDCLSFYFNGLFNRRLTQYLQEDLKHDTVPESHLSFLHTLSEAASMILVSYRYQSQFEFLNSLEQLKLTENGLFGPNNAFAVGEPGTSSDGSKARFVGGMWRREIRAQRRLTSSIGKTFPPIIIGDSIRDIHFAVDTGGVFFGVSETGEDSPEMLLAEFKKQSGQLNIRSRVFSSLADEQLQRRLLEECEAYRNEIDSFKSTA